MSKGFQTSRNAYGGGAGRYLICEVMNVKDDTEQSGRVQVRVMGYQGDESTIPKEDLRWARIKHGPTNPMNNGVGGPAVGMTVGTMAYGFFADGDAAQQLTLDGTMGSPATKGDDENSTKEKSDIPPHTRTNNDEHGQAGDLRWDHENKLFTDKSVTLYAKDESKNSFGRESSKDADESNSWSLGMHQYE